MATCSQGGQQERMRLAPRWECLRTDPVSTVFTKEDFHSCASPHWRCPGVPWCCTTYTRDSTCMTPEMFHTAFNNFLFHANTPRKGIEFCTLGKHVYTHSHAHASSFSQEGDNVVLCTACLLQDAKCSPRLPVTPSQL